MNSFAKYVCIGLLVGGGMMFTSCGLYNNLVGSSQQHVEPEKGEVKEPKKLSERQSIKLERTFIEANTEKILGNKAKALKKFKKCLSIQPAHHPSMYEMARLHMEMEHTDEALHYSKRAVAHSDSLNKYYQETFAEALQKKGYYQQAANIYKKLVDQSPQNHKLYLKWAFMLIKAKKWEKALQVYEKLEERVGVNPKIAKQKQKLYIRAGKFDKAVEEMKALIDTFPRNTQYKIMLAKLYEANDYTKKAVAIYEKILEDNPNNAQAQLSLAQYYKQKGNQDKYENILHKLFSNPEINIDKKVKILVRDFDLMKQRSQKTPKGVKLGKVLTETHPDNAKSYSVYGDFLYQNGSLEKALAQYQKAIKLDNSKYSLWRQKLVILSELKKYDALIQEADKAIELFPNQPHLYYLKSLALMQNKKYEEVIETTNQGLQLQPQNKTMKAQMYSNLAESYYNLEQYAKSDSCFEKSLKLNPENTYVMNNYSFYLSNRGENLERAAELARKANELESGNSAFQDTYGWVLFKQGKYEKSKKWIKKALNNGGDQRPVILEHYGDVLFKLGEKDKAVKYWKKAKENGAKSSLIDKKIANEKLYK